MKVDPGRRLDTFVLAGVLVVSSLIGCGGDPDDGPAANPAEISATTEIRENENNRLLSKKNSSRRGPTEPIELAPREPYVAGGSPETEREGEDWPQFLGLQADSVSGETGLLDQWPAEGPKVLWKMRTGNGYAAPSIVGNRLIFFHRQDDEDVVECLTADTGEPLWRKTFPTHYIDRYGSDNGPRCTPLVTKDKVYTFHPNGRLSCLNLADGEAIWMWNTNAKFDVPPGFFGAGSTPVVEGDLLIVMVGGQPRSGVVAFNAHTGDVIWENVGNGDWDMTGKFGQRDKTLASYSSLAVREIHGRRHLLALMRQGLISLDPQTGEINFSYFFRSRMRYSVNAAMPVAVDDQIFLSAEYGVGSLLLRVGEEGKSVEEIWKDKELLRTHFATPIYLDRHLYAFHGFHGTPSSMRCIELASGKLKWIAEEDSSKVLGGSTDGSNPVEPRRHFRGSAVLADGKFIVLGERGTLSLVAADPEKFQEICRVNYPEMKYPSWTAPVLSRKRLYIRCLDDARNRSEYYLLCVDLAASSQE